MKELDLHRPVVLEGELLTPEEEEALKLERRSSDERARSIARAAEQHRAYMAFVMREQALAKRRPKKEREPAKEQLNELHLIFMVAATIFVIWLAGIGFNYLKELFK